MLYIDIAKVDRDVAHFVMAIHVCFKCMFQMFQLFQMNVASVFIWMLHIHARSKHMFQVFSGVSYVCLQVFHVDIAYICNGFQVFSDIFTSVSDACFKCFISLLLYVAFACFKSRSSVAHEVRVGSGWLQSSFVVASG